MRLICAWVWVWVWVLVVGYAQVRPGIGLKESSPELYRKLKTEANTPVPNLGQMVAQHDAIRHEATRVAAQLVVLIKQMDDLSIDMTRLKSQVAEKDMSRVALLEDRNRDQDAAVLKSAAKAQASYDNLLAWVRPMFFTVLAAAISIGAQIFFSRKRDNARAAQVQIVKTDVQVVKGGIETLKNQTDGMTNNIERLATDKGISIGRAEADTTNAQVAEMLRKEKTDLEIKNKELKG